MRPDRPGRPSTSTRWWRSFEPGRASASHTAARCPSSSRVGTGTLHSAVQTSFRIVIEWCDNAAVTLALVGEAHAQRGDRPAAEDGAAFGA